MSVKVSHSGIETFQTCGRKYFLEKKEKIIPICKGSALFVGVSFDSAFNDILMNHGKGLTNHQLYKIGIKSFLKKWRVQEDRNLGKIILPKNSENIQYTKKDLEEGILTDLDGTRIEKYFQELLPAIKAQLNPEQELSFSSGYELFQYLREMYKSFHYFSSEFKSFYNYVNWLSIRRKGPYFIKAYIEDLLPHISKVVSVQTDLEMKDGEDSLIGVADFICQLKDYPGENIIADNKTSSKLYAGDTVEKSSQLAKYKEILNENDPKLKIDKGAYFVIVKELKQISNKTCTVCGHKTTGLSKSCDNKQKGKKRCGGEYTVEISYKAQTQLVVDSIPDSTIQQAMESVGSTIQAIKEEKFDPDWSKCDYQYGSPCSYKRYCSEGCMTGLMKAEKKK